MRNVFIKWNQASSMSPLFHWSLCLTLVIKPNQAKARVPVFTGVCA